MKKLTKTLAAHKIVAGWVVLLLLVGTATFLTAAKDGEKPARGFLGVNMEPISSADKEEFQVKFGVLVVGVVKGEAAEKAGIKKYDVIQFLNDEKMRRTEDLSETIGNLTPGSKVVIKLVRDGKEMSLTATLGKSPEGPRMPYGEKYFSPKGDFPKGDFPKGDFPQGPFVYKSMGSGVFLGIRLQELSPGLAEYFGVKADGGALILNVEKDSPAEKAGLKDGDVIQQLDGKNIKNPEDVINAISKKEKGDTVEIQVLRHNKKETLKAQLEAKKHNEFIRIFKHGEGDDEDISINIPKIQIEKFNQKGEKLRELEKRIHEKIEKQCQQIELSKEKAEQKIQTMIKKIKEKTYSI